VSFDIRPLETYRAKLDARRRRELGVFLEHDPKHEVITIRRERNDLVVDK
jgi:hypothetical protein